MGFKNDYWELRNLRNSIERRKDEVCELLAAAESTTKPLNPIEGGKGASKGDRIEAIMAKVMDLESEIAEAESAYEFMNYQFVFKMTVMEKPKQKQLAIERYLRERSLHETALVLGVSKQYVCRSLKNFEKN